MKSDLRYYFLAAVFFSCRLIAQPSFHYLDKVTVEQGLSSNAISDIVQDGNGFLWIGTSYGLNRYDGSEIKNFFSQNNDHSLADNNINALILLDSFHIAVATNHGLSIFNTQDESFRNLLFNTRTPLDPYNNYLKLLSKDRQGNLWVASLTCLYRFNSSLQLEKTFCSDYKADKPEKFRIQYIKKIIPLESGNILFWSDTGILIWNHATDQMQNIDLSSSSPWHILDKVSFAECFKVSGHYLIIFKPGKLLVYDELTGKTASCLVPTGYHNTIDWLQKVSPLENGWLAYSLEKKGLAFIRINNTNNNLTISLDGATHFPESTFRKWIKDTEGNWWATTDVNGLIKISSDKQLFEEKRLIDPSTRKVSDFEITGYSSFGYRFFIATYGDGIYELDSSSNKLLHHTVDLHKSFQNNIWNIHYYKNDTLWMGTGSGLISFSLGDNKYAPLKLSHPSALDSFSITAQYTDSKGLVWIGIGAGHGLCVYNPATEKFTSYPSQEGYYPFRYPLSIAEDSASNLWFLSDNTHDLVTWNRNLNQFTIVPVTLLNGKRNLPTGNFYLDKKGIIWYGVRSFGLVKYNTHNGYVETYGIDKGLNTDMIFNITEDNEGRLWLGTSQGLSIFYPSSHHFINLKSADGLPSNPCSASFYFDTSSDRMFAGAPGRIISFNPGDFQIKKDSLPVLITDMLVNGNKKIIPPDKKIKLQWNENNITIHFTGINLTNGTENKYAYKLGDKNAMWVNLGKQRQINLASLNPGKYDFYIRSARKNGTWSNITDHLTLIITPPFSATVWFYLLILSLVAAAIYAWYRYRLQQVLKLEKIRARISHNLHDEIGSRLTNISMMSLVAKNNLKENRTTHQLLDHIKEESEAVSQSMREIVWNINPDNDAMEEAFPRMLRYTTDVLETKGINVKASIAELKGVKMEMEKRKDLFSIFKESLQNIIRHSDATTVTITVALKDKYLSLQIADDGKGFDINNLSFQNGLKYMRQRADLHHWSFSVNSLPQQGTEINVIIKYS